MGILDTIFSDPSSAGGGWLYQLLGGMKSNPGASTSTPTTPPPVQSALGLPFAPRQGLLGNSLFGDAVRGGLAGLQGSTGYSGFGAQLGAGAQAGTQALRKRQQFQMENMLAGQQYQSGQQGLIGGNLGNAQSLWLLNAKRQKFGQPPITMNDLASNPQLANDLYGNQQSAQTGAPVSPQIGGVNPMGAPPQQGQQGAQPPPQQGADNTQPQDDGVDPNNPVFQQQLQSDALVFGPQYAQMELDARSKGLGYQTKLAQTQADNTNLAGRASGAPVYTWRNGKLSVAVAPSIDAGGATGIEVNPGQPGQSHIVTGLPVGVPEQYQGAVTRDTSLRQMYTGSGPADRQNILDQLGTLAQSTAFGPGQPAKYKWEALANALPFVGFDASKGDQANVDIFNKLVSNLGMQYQKAMGGTGTDLQLSTAMEGIPSVDKMSSAIAHIVPYMKSLEAAGAAQVAARDKWISSHGGLGGGRVLKDFETEWNKSYDPMVFQYEQMDGPGRDAFKADLMKNPDKLKQFRQHLQALTSLGAIQ